MILIADSGSSKTDWFLAGENPLDRQSFSTAGFNPMTQSKEFIETEIKNAASLRTAAANATHLFYYGAGCSSSDRIAIIQNALSIHFPKAAIHVTHDIAGAVIACCGSEPGIACILGTGSNAVLFDGHQIIYPKGTLGLGYILGDEGSGAYMGKKLLRDYLYKILPETIEQYLSKELGLSKDNVLNAVYKQPNANKYLASFAPVLNMYANTEYVHQLVFSSFDEFFRYNVCTFPEYNQYPVNFVGSIALHFQVTLRDVCQQHGVNMGRIVHRPAENMALYHLETLSTKST